MLASLFFLLEQIIPKLFFSNSCWYFLSPFYQQRTVARRWV